MVAPLIDEDWGGVVQVVPLLKLSHLGDRRYDYRVPPTLSGRIVVGSVVTAPFGRRSARAVVVSLDGAGEGDPAGLRDLEAVADQSIPEELVTLASAVAERYLSTFESCLRLVVPPTAGSSGSGGGRPRHAWVTRSSEPPAQAPDEKPLTVKQKALLEAIPLGGASPALLCSQAGVGVTVLRALVRRGLVELGEGPSEKRAGEEQTTGALGVGPRLWPEQEEAVRDLVEAYEAPGLARRLLWGVTGSGKTEVYLQVVARVLRDGAGAILLVPEIALTPQMIERVRARFGNAVGVLHSGLPPAARRREYRRIAEGEARVVVGARSAVFAPVADLRLVIVDESHDGSYKQEEEPRYHAGMVAELRLRGSGGLLLEGSATPAVETVSRSGECLRLTHRAAGSMPDCEAVDMRHQGGGQLLAPRSRDALAETLRRGEQAIILLNRRGFAGHVHCELCGHVMNCGDCELSLTYHSRERRLICHHCGRAYVQPRLCPACGQAPLTKAAPGTERLDRELRRLVPHEHVFRLDSDVLTSGSRVRAVLQDFASKRPSVLVGTQMVAKGHDFADVTLVIVADADTGLYVPDFRAAERTFQLLTQVAGRAGRAERPGRVLVQTWNPEVPCIRMALERDEKAFYDLELDSRKRLGYPPFAELVRMTTVAERSELAELSARHLLDRLGRYFGGHELHGPVRLPTLRGRSRWHLLVAARDGQRARVIVGQALAQLRDPYRQRGVRLLVDVDPLSFG
jgi:primosomal protein N' (replication factor Y)